MRRGLESLSKGSKPSAAQGASSCGKTVRKLDKSSGVADALRRQSSRAMKATISFVRRDQDGSKISNGSVLEVSCLPRAKGGSPCFGLLWVSVCTVCTFLFGTLVGIDGLERRAMPGPRDHA